jgi:hypothetical protein
MLRAAKAASQEDAGSGYTDFVAASLREIPAGQTNSAPSAGSVTAKALKASSSSTASTAPQFMQRIRLGVCRDCCKFEGVAELLSKPTG